MSLLTYALLIVVILFSLIIYLLLLVYLGKKSVNWPSTTGKLLLFRIIKARSISLKIKYEYVVDGNKYIGKRICYLNPLYESVKEIESDAFCNQIKEDNFKVYFCAKHPKISTLQTGFKGWFIVIFSISLLLIGICGIVINSLK